MAPDEAERIDETLLNCGGSRRLEKPVGDLSSNSIFHKINIMGAKSGNVERDGLKKVNNFTIERFSMNKMTYMTG